MHLTKKTLGRLIGMPGCVQKTWILSYAAMTLLLLLSCSGGSTVDIESDFTLIGSQNPSSVSIPDLDGLRNMAFVLTSSPPLGVFVFELDHIVPPLPFEFYNFNKGLQGVPDDLVIIKEDLAFITTGNEFEGVWAFNPNPSDQGSFQFFSSYIYTGAELTLPREAEDSRGVLVDHVRPTLTSGVALSHGKVYISTSNFTQVGPNPACAPGTIQIIGLDESTYPPQLTELGDHRLIITTDFNPGEITPLGDHILLVTNTGVLAIRDDAGVPLSEGSVDVIDTDLDCIVATYPLGFAAPSFKKIALTPDGTRGYLGSAAYNHVYELDLTGLENYLGICNDEDPPVLADKVLHGSRNPNPPIRATLDPEGSTNLVPQVVLDYGGTRAYATGYNSGTLAVLELETVPGFPSPRTPIEVIQVTDPMPTQNEAGPGPLAVRPGIPGESFQGPDLYVVTGLPIGELRGIYTY